MPLEILSRIQKHYQEQVERLAKNAIAISNLPPIYRAIIQGNTKELSALIRENSAVTLNVDGNEILPFVYVLCTKNNELIKLFLDNHFVADQLITSLGISALHVAVLLKESSLVEYLLKTSSDINIQDEMGYTPLHHAVELDILEIVQLLCRHPNIKFNATSFIRSCHTSLTLARTQEGWNKIEIIECLEDAIRNLTKSLWNSIKTNNKDEFLKLLISGTDLSLMDLDIDNRAIANATDFNILHYASLYGNREMQESIMQHYPSLARQRDSLGRLPRDIQPCTQALLMPQFRHYQQQLRGGTPPTQAIEAASALAN